MLEASGTEILERLPDEATVLD
ncbi:MAG: hypothetical protein QOG39_311, partial [Acidimicrobiaceae bacterium]